MISSPDHELASFQFVLVLKQVFQLVHYRRYLKPAAICQAGVDSSDVPARLVLCGLAVDGALKRALKLAP